MSASIATLFCFALLLIHYHLNFPYHYYIVLSVIHAFWIVLPIGLLGLLNCLIVELAAISKSVEGLKVGHAIIFF